MMMQEDCDDVDDDDDDVNVDEMNTKWNKSLQNFLSFHFNFNALYILSAKYKQIFKMSKKNGKNIT